MQFKSPNKLLFGSSGDEMCSHSVILALHKKVKKFCFQLFHQPVKYIGMDLVIYKMLPERPRSGFSLSGFQRYSKKLYFQGKINKLKTAAPKSRATRENHTYRLVFMTHRSLLFLILKSGNLVRLGTGLGGNVNQKLDLNSSFITFLVQTMYCSRTIIELFK